MIVAQRRGKVQEKSSTVLVPEDEQKPGSNSNNNNNNNDPLHVPNGNGGSSTSTNNNIIRVATVRRNFCGTGPFDRHWLNLDACGLFCALFTYALHVYGVYAVTLILLPPWMSNTKDETGTTMRTISFAGFLHQFVFTMIATLAIISHFKAMTTDPGAVPPDASPLPVGPDTNNNTDNKAIDPLDMSQKSQAEQQRSYLLDPPDMKHVKRLCRRCKSFKPQRAHHCSVCRRCIIKMDHHCPWVNNCVGIGNHKYFLLFVFYTFLSCCYSLSLIVIRFTTCTSYAPSSRSHYYHRAAAESDVNHLVQQQQLQHHYQHRDTCLDRPSHLILILGLLIEALLFGLFTSCMMFDQFEVVRSKITHIDRFKGGDINGTLAGVIEVFGVGQQGIDTSFRPDWLSPFVRVCFPSSVTNEVMGFCRPCHPAKETTTNRPPNSGIGSSGNARPKPPTSLVEIV